MNTTHHHRAVKIILVRHGLTEWNKDRRYQGHTDVPLSPEGRKQADAVGKKLSCETIDRVYSSDLSRARETAERIAAHHNLDVRLDRRLREISFGQWEGLTFDEITARWPDLQRRWLADPVNLSAPGGETARELEARLKEALLDIHADLTGLYDSTGRMPCGVIVTHGGVIRALIAYAETGSMTDMWKRDVRQASITTCELSARGLRVHTSDDVSHLEGI